MSNKLYGRVIEVIAGEPGPGQRIFNGDDFTIYFTVPFDDGGEPNIAEIEIYNLAEGSIVNLNKRKKITINAGYKGDVGVIFSGEIQTPITDWEGVNKVTSLDCIDSGETWYIKRIKRTYKKNTTGWQILNDLLKQTGLGIGALNLPKNITYISGKTFDTTMAEAIAEVARDCGAKMYVNKGRVFVRPKREGDNIYFVIDKNHGLIGSPTRIEKEERYNVVEKVKVAKKERIKGTRKYKTVTKYENKNVAKTRIKKGWKVVSLLNHRVTTDSIFEIRSKTANGRFRVETGQHRCYGSTFYTEMEVFPV